MMQLKKLSAAGVEQALAKAERYRLLNEPWQAESICLDILAADPDNQQALVMLLLSLTDQFKTEHSPAVDEVRALLPQIQDEYERAYHAGIICERRGRAFLERGAAGAAAVALPWFRQAMDWYDKAEAIKPPGNDSALLRWNTCARALEREQVEEVAAGEFQGQEPLE
jgi:hypothetical protein